MAKPPDNFFKVLQALQYACQKTALCIKNVVDSWHSKEQPKQQPCRQPQACKGIKGKPNPKSSCRECINWGKAVEGAHYPQSPQIAWRNIETSLLHTNAIEVCNGFALNLPSGQRPTKMADYDTASILKIMMGFGVFHQSNQATTNFPKPYQTIQKVSSIRNNLSHYPMDKQLSMDDLTMQQNFQDISDFVQCLVDLQHVTQREADDIKTHLDQILKSPSQLTLEMGQIITDAMKKGLQEFQDQNKVVAKVLKMISAQGVEIDGLRKEMSETQQTQKAQGVEMDRSRQEMSETRQIQEVHGADISSLKVDVNQLKTDIRKGEEENVARWRNKLKDKYLRERKKIRFGKGNQEIADIDDIFVDLSICLSLKNSNVQIPNIHDCYKPFESYADLLHLKTAKDKPQHHILVSGVAGSGKTTLLSRIACDWAKEEETSGTQQSSKLASNAGDSSWSKFKLLFLLDIKKIKADTSLEQAIKSQLLPGVSEESISCVMSNLEDSCLVLLDGFDEVQADVDINDSALCSPLLGTCFIIVTSRPHMVDHFCSISPEYAIIGLSGFSWKNSLLYIQRFFRKQEHLGNRFIEKVKATPLLRALSPFPILLVMMCILWEHSQRKETAFKSLTGLYQQAVVYLNKPFRRPAPLFENIDSILEALGKPGLTSLFNNNLQIDKSDFDDETILKKSFHMGLAYEEECPGETVVYFIHKTFQEFCSAKYLVSLAESDHSLFELHLKKIDEKNVLAMHYLLQFSCGLNSKAAVMIFSHVVNLLSTKPNNRYQNHWSLPLRLLYEMETNDSSDSQQMHPLLQRLADHYLIVDFSDRELSYIISHFIETDKHSPDMWLRYVKCLIIQNGNIEHFISQLLNHTPALQQMQLEAISFEEDTNMSISTTFNDLDEFTIKKSKFSALILQRFLKSMPFVSNLNLEGVSIIGEMDPSLSVACKSVIDFNLSGNPNSMVSVACKSVIDFNLSGNPNSVDRFLIGSNTLSQVLACLPALQSVCLDELHLQLVTENFKTTIGQSVKKIYIRNGEVQPNAMLRIMSCMPILETVEFDNVGFTSEVDYTVDSQQCSLKCLNLSRLKESLRMTLLLGLLNYMPLLENIRIESQFDLLGELDLERVRPCNQLKKATFWSWYRTNKFNIETLVRLLAHCAPSIERVILDNVEHVGEFDGPLSVTCASLRELTICPKYHSSIAKSWTISINALVKALHCLPSLQLLELGLLDITGYLDASVPKLKSGIKSFLMEGGSLSASVLSVLLDCLPVVEKMTVGKLRDQADVIENVCRSLKTLDLSASSDITIQANTVVGFVGVMPALEELKLEKVDSKDTVHDNILVNGKTVRCLCLKKCSFTADGVIRFLRHMKRLERITLDEVNINNDTDTERILDCSFVEDFNMKSGSISAGAIVKLLCCMPHICKVTLCMLTDEASDRTVKCNELRELTVSQSNLGVHKMTKLMQYMPSLQKLVMDKVNIAGQVHVDIAYELRFLRMYEMNESTISAGALLMLVHLMPALKTVKLYAVQITGELSKKNAAPCKSVQSFSLSARSSNQFASATEKQTCSVNAAALFGLLGCMVDLVELDLEEVEVVGELSADTQIRCHKLEKIMMKGGSVSAKAIMTFLEHTHAVSIITLGSTLGEVEVNLKRSTKLMLAKELVVQQDKNPGNLSGEKLVRFLHIMPALEKATIRVPELGNIETAENVRCVNLKELEISELQFDVFIPGSQRSTIEANTALKFSGISQCLETLILKQVDVRVEMQAASNCQPFESLTDLLMIAVSITSETLMQYLHKMPTIERLSLLKMNILGLFESNSPMAFRCLKMFNLSGNEKPLKVSAKMVAMMPSLTFLRIVKFELVGEFDCSRRTLGTSLTDVYLSDGTIGTVSFFQYLLTLPSLKKLYLSNVHKVFLPDVSIKSKSFEEITLSSSNATALLQLLQRMPCVRKVNMIFRDLEIEGTFPLHVKFDAVKEFSFTHTLRTSDANSIAQILHCMPSLEKVLLRLMKISGDLSLCNILNWQSLKEFSMVCYSSSCAKANAIMRLLRKMPALEMLQLEYIRGAFDVTEFSFWKSLKIFRLGDVTINTGTFLKLLSFMPVLEILTVRVTLDGNADESYSLSSILEFKMIGSKSSFTTLMSVVDCMPALRKLTLEDVQVEGSLDENRSELGAHLAELSLVNMKLETSTCIGMLRRTKALKTVSLQKVQLIGVAHCDQYGMCESVKELQIGNRYGSMDANIPLLLMKCMPSLLKMTLEGTYRGEVDVSIHPQCKELKELCLQYVTMDTNAFVRYINCMPALQIVNSARPWSYLNSMVRLTGEWDESIEIACQSITEFSCSLVNRVRFLEAFLARQQALIKFKLKSELSISDKERVLAVVNSVSSNLKCLELDGIAPVSYVNKLPEHLITMLASCLPNLQELRFPNTNMTEMQCDKFLEMLISTADTAIGQKPSHALPLQWLDLSGSEISNAVGKLVQVLAHMRYLRGLLLSSCSLEERHCQELSPTIASLNHLVVLDLSDNQGVASILASHLRWGKNVKVLKLSGARIRDEDLSFLPLGQMCGLTELDLSNNPFGDAGLETLLDSVDQEGPYSCDENTDSDTAGLSSDSDSMQSDSDDSFVGALTHHTFLPDVETLIHSVKQEGHFTSDEDTDPDNDGFSSGSCNSDSDSDDSFVSAVSHMPCPHHALKKLSLRDCNAIGAKGVERLLKDLPKFPKLEELDMTGISLVTYKCMHSPRLCTYLKAAGGTIKDEDNDLFYDEYLSLYDADTIKSIKNSSVGE